MYSRPPVITADDIYNNENAKTLPLPPTTVPNAGLKTVKNGGYILEYENYGEETVIVKAEESSIRMTINIFNCNKTTFVIAGKINTVFVSGCHKCNVTLNEVVGQAGIFACSEMKVYPMIRVPQFTIEKCNQVQIYYTHDSKGNSNQVSVTASY